MSAPSVPYLEAMLDQTKLIDPTRPGSEAHDLTMQGHSSFYDQYFGSNYSCYNLLPDYIRQFRSYRYPIEQSPGNTWDNTKYPWMFDEWMDEQNMPGSATLVGDLVYAVADNITVRPIWQIYEHGYSGYMGMAEERKLSGLAGAIVLGDQTSYNSLPNGGQTSTTDMTTLLHKNFQELVVVPADWFAGQDAAQPFSKPFIVMNDHSYSITVTLWWSLSYHGGLVVYTSSTPLSLTAGEHLPVNITATLPVMTGVNHMDLNVILYDQSGNQLYSDTLPYTVTQRPSFISVPEFLVMGANQTFTNLLTSLGFNYTTSGSPPGKVIVVATGASLSSSQWTTLQNYVKNSGNSALICTTNLPSSFCGVPLTMTDLQTNTVHIDATDHTIFSSLQPQDVRFWAPDYRMASNCLQRPAYGSFTTLLDTSYSSIMDVDDPNMPGPGMTATPMIEINAGTGHVIVTQVPLFEKAVAEAVDALLLSRILGYLNTTATAPLPVVNANLTLPSAISLSTTTWSNLSASTTSAVLMDGSSSSFGTIFTTNISAIITFLQGGGRLYIHNLTPSNCAVVNGQWSFFQLTGTATSADRLLLLPTSTSVENWMWYQTTTTPWPLWLLPQPQYDPILRGISHYQTCWYQPSIWSGPTPSSAPIISTALSGNASYLKVFTQSARAAGCQRVERTDHLRPGSLGLCILTGKRVSAGARDGIHRSAPVNLGAQFSN